MREHIVAIMLAVAHECVVAGGMPAYSFMVGAANVENQLGMAGDCLKARSSVAV